MCRVADHKITYIIFKCGLLRNQDEDHRESQCRSPCLANKLPKENSKKTLWPNMSFPQNLNISFSWSLNFLSKESLAD